MSNKLGKCLNCKRFIDQVCKNPDSPYGGKFRLSCQGCWAFTN